MEIIFYLKRGLRSIFLRTPIFEASNDCPRGWDITSASAGGNAICEIGEDSINSVDCGISVIGG